MADRWYRDGLRFTCTECGACCSGEPGYVWVNKQEAQDIAEFMDMDVEEFRDRFVRREGNRYSLIEYSDGDCIFLDPKTRGCSVYPARPIQCRTWPFWPSNLTSRKAWEETCRECPGAGQGKLYSIDQIDAQRARKRV